MCGWCKTSTAFRCTADWSRMFSRSIVEKRSNSAKGSCVSKQCWGQSSKSNCNANHLTTSHCQRWKERGCIPREVAFDPSHLFDFTLFFYCYSITWLAYPLAIRQQWLHKWASTEFLLNYATKSTKTSSPPAPNTASSSLTSSIKQRVKLPGNWLWL
jgi:hypothetical protein